MKPEEVPQPRPRTRAAFDRDMSLDDLLVTIHIAQLRRVGKEIDTALDPIIEKFRAMLLPLEGKSFEELEQNQQIAEMIQETADRLRVAFKCTKCSQPARLRCSETANTKAGMFVFSHGRHTHGGKITIPKLEVVEAAPDGRKRKSDEGT